MVQVVHHHRPAQQSLGSGAEAGIAVHQVGSHRQVAGLLFQPLLPQLGGAEGGEGQAGDAAAVPLLDQAEDGLTGRLILHQEVLHGAPQGGLQGHGVGGGHVELLPHRADDPPQGPLPGGRHGGFHPFGIALVVAGHLPQGPGPGGQGALLGLEGHPGLLRLGGLPAEGSQGLPVGLQSTLPGQGLVPALGLGGLQGLLGLADGFLEGGLPLLQLGQAGLLAGDVPLQLLPPVLVLVQVGLGLLGRGLVGPDPVLEQVDALAAVPPVGLILLDLGAEGFPPGLLFLELGQEALPLGIEGVGLGRPLCQLGLGRGAVGGQGLAGLPLAVQLGHPEGDFQPPQLFPQVQVLPGLLGLGFQGASLEVQFLQLIPDAHQVFLGALQLALGLLLLVAAVGDPRRLLKDLPPLGALGGEDLVDAALADEGVPLLAQAGVHEEFIHIPQADGLAVEEVFTLPGAVVPPGDRHLLPPVGEEIPALFQGEGDLGKALAAAGLGPAEDHILHLAPPEGFGGLLPQNPADGVGEVGLSAAVGPHDGGDGMLEGEDRPVRKGLEPLQFQRFQPQGVFLLWVCRDGFGPRPGSRRGFRREMGMIHFIIATPQLFCNG